MDIKDEDYGAEVTVARILKETYGVSVIIPTNQNKNYDFDTAFLAGFAFYFFDNNKIVFLVEKSRQKPKERGESIECRQRQPQFWGWRNMQFPLLLEFSPK